MTYTREDYSVFAARLQDAGFTLLHEGFGPNVQRTGNDPAYIVFLSSDYTRLKLPVVAQEVLQALPEFKAATAYVKTYKSVGGVCNEVWVYLSL